MQEIGYLVELFHISVAGLVILCWAVLIVAYFARQKPPRLPERKRENAWVIGMVLQGLAYLVVCSAPRWRIRSSLILEFVLDLAALLLAGGSAWILFAAVPRLGSQFAATARIVEGHRLITDGPYGLVRHPIYTGMTGMLLATGFAIGHWSSLIIAAFLFAAGTAIRILSEEKLLREAFEAEYETYARKVPAIVPPWRSLQRLPEKKAKGKS